MVLRNKLSCMIQRDKLDLPFIYSNFLSDLLSFITELCQSEQLIILCVRVCLPYSQAASQSLWDLNVVHLHRSLRPHPPGLATIATPVPVGGGVTGEEHEEWYLLDRRWLGASPRASGTNPLADLPALFPRLTRLVVCPTQLTGPMLLRLLYQTPLQELHLVEVCRGLYGADPRSIRVGVATVWCATSSEVYFDRVLSLSVCGFSLISLRSPFRRVLMVVVVVGTVRMATTLPPSLQSSITCSTSRPSTGAQTCRARVITASSRIGRPSRPRCGKLLCVCGPN